MGLAIPSAFDSNKIPKPGESTSGNMNIEGRNREEYSTAVADPEIVNKDGREGDEEESDGSELPVGNRLALEVLRLIQRRLLVETQGLRRDDLQLLAELIAEADPQVSL